MIIDKKIDIVSLLFVSFLVLIKGQSGAEFRKGLSGYLPVRNAYNALLIGNAIEAMVYGYQQRETIIVFHNVAAVKK